MANKKVTPRKNSKNMKNNELDNRYKKIFDKFELNDEQREALLAMINGENIFLTGSAGTGKSYILQKYIFMMKKMQKNVLVTAPTGKAAIHIAGVTLHKAFHIPVEFGKFSKGPHGSCDYLSQIDVLVIDEISMCRVDVFDYVMKCVKLINKIRTKHNKPNLQLIFVGDFFQLPPVIKKSDRALLAKLYKTNEDAIGDAFAFQSKNWHDMKIKTIILNDVIRQNDDDMVSQLNSAREGDTSCISYFNSVSNKDEINDGIFLSGTRKKVDSINQECLSQLTGDTYIFRGETSGNVSDYPAPIELEIKIGCRVILLKNDVEKKYANGDMGYVKGINDDMTIKVQVDNGNFVDIAPCTWENTMPVFSKTKNKKGKETSKVIDKVIGKFRQYPICLGYAITIHKSQGMTYDKVNLAPFCFTEGQLYVALSRCRSIENLHLEYPIYQKYLMTNNDVFHFYKDSKIVHELGYPLFG